MYKSEESTVTKKNVMISMNGKILNYFREMAKEEVKESLQENNVNKDKKEDR